MHQAARHRLGNFAQILPRDRVRLEEVTERAERVVLRNQPEFDFAVLEDVLFGADKVEDVWVIHARKLVNFLLGDPRLFVLGGKNFDRDVIALHFPLPHCSEATVRFNFQQINRPDHEALR